MLYAPDSHDQNKSYASAKLEFDGLFPLIAPKAHT